MINYAPPNSSQDSRYGDARIYPLRGGTESSVVWLMEGEWDCLLANQLHLAAETTTGGASTWKAWWSERYAGKSVNVVYDMDSAGREGAIAVCAQLVRTAREVRNIQLPIEDGDFSDWILRGGGTADELRRIAAETPVEAVPEVPEINVYADDRVDPTSPDCILKDLIDSFHWRVTSTGPMYNSGLLVPKHVLTTAVVQWFQSHGGTFVWATTDGQGYLFFQQKRFPLASNDPEFLSFLQDLGGINARDSEGQIIITALCNCGAFAKRVEPRPWLTSHGERLIRIAQSPMEPILEVGCDENNQPVVREVENGDDDLWQAYATEGSNAEYVPWVYDPDVDKQEALALLYSHCVEHFMVSDIGRELLITWFLSALLAHLSAIQPGVRLWGEAGSGKSTILQLLFWLLHGTERGLLPTYSTASLWRVGISEPMLLIDNQNVESEMSEDLRTFFDLAATGGSREIAADSKGRRTIKQRVHSLVAVSGLDSFLAQDVLTRYFEIETDAARMSPHGYFLSLDRRKLLDARPKIWSGIIKLLAEDVFPLIFSTSGREFVSEIRQINARKERTSEFLSLMVTWGGILSRYEPRLVRPTENDPTGIELARRWCVDVTRSTIESQINAATTLDWWETVRQQIKMHMNQLVVQHRVTDRVEEVVLSTPTPLAARLVREGDRYVGIEGTTIELFNVLRWAAGQVRERLPWASPRQLGQVYRTERAAWEVESLGWKRELGRYIRSRNEGGEWSSMQVNTIYWPEELAILKTEVPIVETARTPQSIPDLRNFR
jgi:hypothetical protein